MADPVSQTTPGSFYAGHGAAPKPVAKVNVPGRDGARIVGWQYEEEWPGLHQLPADPLAQAAEIQRLRAALADAVAALRGCGTMPSVWNALKRGEAALDGK